MDAVSPYRKAFDDAWSHAWESLHAVLQGVTEDEAHWQAPCYADDEPEAHWPAPGTIAWQVAHVTHCKRYYTEIMRHRGATERPPTPSFEPAPDFAAQRAALEEAHAAQRAMLASLTDDDLALRASNDMTLPEFLRMMTRHDTWHAAQIAVARRLWRTRST